MSKYFLPYPIVTYLYGYSLRIVTSHIITYHIHQTPFSLGPYNRNRAGEFLIPQMNKRLIIPRNCISLFYDAPSLSNDCYSRNKHNPEK
ncbi:hypothetical protein EYC80_009597 [Monilinia laxa]|uniref:Uncharacterized protein n=1 Tax=Monilinia laxa TaxID=61186 RepID=A0A5N6JYC0_MONLA|nr:hypothetical protein EYC80_009597 [Monilinia laxa]